MGVLEAIGLDIPNFVKHVLDFVKDVPRVPKCIWRWGLTPNHFLIGSQKKLWTINVQMGVLEALRSNVPNFEKHVPDFVKDVPRVPKCIPRWGSTPNHFFMGSKMKSWTIHVHMGVPKAIGLDIPNFVKHVPNFPKRV